MKKILLVENDAINSMVIKTYLEELYEIVCVESGEEAISVCSKNEFDIILMDINLGKGLDGLQTAKRIRQFDNFKSIPIIAVTAFAMDGDREEFLKNGCTHYLSKPFLRDDIINLLEKVSQI